MRPLIVALDVETDREAIAMVGLLRSQVDVFKVGPVLFMKYGMGLVRDIRSHGVQVFLDMKFHDIPSVVAKAIARAGEAGVYSATIHTAGGLAMMKAAAVVSKRPKLWGVTVLTSLDKKDLTSIGVGRPLQAQVKALAQLAAKAGIEGVISSVEEAKIIKKACGPRFEVVTPGIRVSPEKDDQKRVHTPKEAVKSGADFFVIGRPVIESANPLETVQAVYLSLGR